MKIKALAPFPFAEADSGGRERIFNLLTSIEQPVEVYVPSFLGEGEIYTKNLTIKALKIDRNEELKDQDIMVAAKAKEMFAPLVADADLVVLEHPWQVEAISTPFIYDAHNKESVMKAITSTELVAKQAGRLEEKALKATHVTYCSQEDSLETNSPSTYIPNGVDLPDRVNQTGYKSRTVVFMGTAHPPNIVAAFNLIKMADILADYQIVIIGGCGDYIQNPPNNVTLVGHISKESLDILLRTSFAFINLMTAGSGTSLKVIKALAYGLPVISTEVGARGYKDACFVADSAHEVKAALGMLRDAKFYKQIADKSVEFAQPYSWKLIGEKFNQVVQSLL